MNDQVYLLVNGKRIERFASYEIDADMYAGASAFSLDLARPETDIRTGMQCELYVNDALELTGIIDSVKPSYDKRSASRKLIVTGRDLMGWAVDAHAETFITIENYTCKKLAELLLAKCPFPGIKVVDYSENAKGRLKTRAARVSGFDTTNALSQIDPGMTVFDVLKEYSRSKGMLFYALPDGSFVFGKPKETGQAAFRITNRMDGKGNNVLSGERSDDISKGYSKVTVVGQKQGQEGFSASQVNIEAPPALDADFPFYKPFILKDEFGGDQPALQARMALEKMRHDRFRVSYTVQGHSQDKKNWSINELCTVRDDDPDFELNDDYLLYGRTFKKSKDEGTTTKLRFGLPGMIA
jgi:prophage tail gpP-like protein